MRRRRWRDCARRWRRERELILESTPQGVGGCFHEEWLKAGETGMVRHFFPWWMERALPGKGSGRGEPDGGRAGADGAARAGSGADRVPAADSGGFSRAGAAGVCRGRRELLFGQRESVFELAAVEARLKTAPEPVERRTEWGAGDLAAAGEGKEYVVAVDPAGGGSEGDYSAARCWRWRRAAVRGVCRARGRAGAGAVVTELAASTTGRGWWWSGTTTAAACWRWRRRRASTGGFTAGRAGGLADDEREPAGGAGALDAALVEEPERFQSRRLLGECRSFVRLPNGRRGAGGDARRPGDGHGDRAGGEGGAGGH
jgi:hypothetical protein